ncbi:diacylglycerol acyltransferase-domain-containing protein [Scheffersomyces coipomensis]|uniref:diacylglycerol acyltransferase-domain-containing protein n=1 Tax=Scheffersomyces coipomensis TaxID=1788519 RepID=UPI00315DF2BB
MGAVQDYPDQTLRHRKGGDEEGDQSIVRETTENDKDSVTHEVSIDVNDSTSTDLQNESNSGNQEKITPSLSSKSVPDSTKKSKPYVNINIAPLNTPLRQRLETLGVIWHTISIPFFICLFLLSVSLGWIVWLAIILPYFIWWYGFDLHTPSNGKVVYRVRSWMTNMILWEWFVDYFPIRVHKSVDFEPTFSEVLVEEDFEGSDDEEDLISEDSRTLIDVVFKRLGLRKRLNDSSSSTNSNAERKPPLRFKRVSTGPRYIFGYHPHGVISMGCMGLFATNAIRNEPFQPPLKFLKPLFHDPTKGVRQFPGIGHVFPLTLTTQFTLPFYRDYLLSLGLTSASAKNIKSLINNGDNSVCIVVGGAQESLLNNMVGSHNNVGKGFKGGKDREPTKKKEIQLVLHKRKGFVKLAIELGNISLVPTFAFGEADLYKLTIPQPGSWGYAFQQWMKTNFQFTVPFFSARGVFIYDFGFLSYRNPINVCMGKPIHIPSGTLEKYKAEHPDFEEKATPVHTISRKDSFSNLFKIVDDKPKRSTIKTKIPQDLLDYYHKLYVEELKRVYEDNKHKYGYGDVELNIIE